MLNFLLFTVKYRTTGTGKKLKFFLDFRYEQQFIGQADEILQKIVFRGNFDKDFKDFLKEKGF
jgi:hypothetical protein